jgi:cytochrome c biogenesis protein CcmG/thiol:disulfide interchange protein DsbE
LRDFALLVALLLSTALHAQEAKSVAPNFALTDLQGHTLKLADYKGKVVLVDFWASWCVPCQAEIPRFIEWQKRYGNDRLQVIGISMDDDLNAARAFVGRYKLNYPVAMGTQELAESFGGILGLPANVVIDRDGLIFAKHVGEVDLKLLEAEIKSLLQK